MPAFRRRFTVSAVVNTDTGELVGTPVVRPGHEDYSRFDTVKPLAGNEQFRWVHVWANSPDEAVTTATAALTADRRGQQDGGEPAVRTLPGEARRRPAPAGGPDNVVALADLVALREWERLAGVPAAARARLVADAVWRHQYTVAYRAASTAAATQVAAAAVQAAAATPGAWHTLHQLTAAAGEVLGRFTPNQVVAPPADRRVVTAAQSAAQSAAASGQLPPWRSVAAVAAVGGHTAGTLAGVLTAATDVLTGWRRRGGPALGESATVAGIPAPAWVNALLADINRAVVERIAVERVTAAPPSAAPTRTAVELARQDQAPGVSARPIRAADHRARPVISRASTSATPRRTP